MGKMTQRRKRREEAMSGPVRLKQHRTTTKKNTHYNNITHVGHVCLKFLSSVFQIIIQILISCPLRTSARALLSTLVKTYDVSTAFLLNTATPPPPSPPPLWLCIPTSKRYLVNSMQLVALTYPETFI